MVTNKKANVRKIKTGKKKQEELKGELEEIDDRNVRKSVVIEKKSAKKHEPDTNEKDNEDDEDDMEPKKGFWKKTLALVLVVVILGVGGYFIKAFLTKTTIETSTVQFAGDARGFSNYFREYLLDRMRSEWLFKYSYKELNTDDILNELSDLKNGFSKVVRGTGDNYKNSEYKELAEVMHSDSSIYLVAVRELKNIMMGSYATLEERQSEFEKRVKETTEGLRSALYYNRAGFVESVSGLSSKGALIFEGSVLVEAGGGVMNIMLGDPSAQITVVTTDDLEETVKLIEAKKLFGYSGSRVVRLGDSLSANLEEGWIRNVKVDVRYKDADVTTMRISLIMRSASRVNNELKEQGINGFIKSEEMPEKEALAELITWFREKK